MTFTLQALAAYCVVVGAITWAAMKLAKPGWEDERGFHAGEPDDDWSDYSGEI